MKTNLNVRITFLILLIIMLLSSIYCCKAQIGLDYQGVMDKTLKIITKKTSNTITTINGGIRCVYYFENDLCVRTTVLNPEASIEAYKKILNKWSALTYSKEKVFWWGMNLSKDKLYVYLIKVYIKHTVTSNMPYMDMRLHKTIKL